MELSARWAARSKDAHKSQSALFGIVQENNAEDLREESLNLTLACEFDGIAIGGLSVGEPKEEKTNSETFIDILPDDKPRYLMGVGKPEDIVEAVFFGVEMFDCVLPTRNARNGRLIASTGVINIRNAKYKNDDSPIDENSDSKVCKLFKSLFTSFSKTNEMLGSMLASYHNIYYYQAYEAN